MRFLDSSDAVINNDNFNTGNYVDREEDAKTSQNTPDNKPKWTQTNSGSFIMNHSFLCVFAALAAFTGITYNQLVDLTPYIDSQSLFEYSTCASSLCFLSGVMQELQNNLQIFNNKKTSQTGEFVDKSEKTPENTALSSLLEDKHKTARQTPESEKTNENSTISELQKKNNQLKQKLAREKLEYEKLKKQKQKIEQEQFRMQQQLELYTDIESDNEQPDKYYTAESDVETKNENKQNVVNDNSQISDADYNKLINRHYFEESFKYYTPEKGYTKDNTEYYYNTKSVEQLVNEGEIAKDKILNNSRLYIQDESFYDVYEFEQNGKLYRKVELSDKQKNIEDNREKQQSNKQDSATITEIDNAEQTQTKEKTEQLNNETVEELAEKYPDNYRVFEISQRKIPAKSGNVKDFQYFYNEKDIDLEDQDLQIMQVRNLLYKSQTYRIIDFYSTKHVTNNNPYFRKVELADVNKQLSNKEIYFRTMNISCYGANDFEDETTVKKIHYAQPDVIKWDDTDPKTVQISYVFEKIQPDQDDNVVYKLIDYEDQSGAICRKIERAKKSDVPKFFLRPDLRLLNNDRYVSLPVHRTTICDFPGTVEAREKIGQHTNGKDNYILLVTRSKKENQPPYYIKYAYLTETGNFFPTHQ